jgi:hypothetical protein
MPSAANFCSTDPAMLHPLTMPARPNRAIITNVALFGALR